MERRDRVDRFTLPESAAPGSAALESRTDCATDTSGLIYVVDKESRLQTFDPRRLPADPFHVVGELRCRDPRSIAVDRNGSVWILSAVNDLATTSLSARSCQPTGYKDDADDHIWSSIAFVLDSPGAETEQLYLTSDGPSRALGAMDPAKRPLKSRVVAEIDSRDAKTPFVKFPLLSGTRSGELYGLWPDAFIQQIDRASGVVSGPRWTLDQLVGKRTLLPPSFAQWGGTFYVFAITIEPTGGNSSVWTVDRKTGAVRLAIAESPYDVFAATSSTCAPDTPP